MRFCVGSVLIIGDVCDEKMQGILGAAAVFAGVFELWSGECQADAGQREPAAAAAKGNQEKVIKNF